MSRFAISDIHGCAKTFRALLDQLQLSSEDTLYLLGDYIDRGNDSKGVIDIILALREEGMQVECLLGNHEWLLLNAMYETSRYENWLQRNGGAKTLESYGIDSEDYLSEMPEKHVKFFKSLSYIIELDDYILVHAGINFRDDDPMSDYPAMIWIRDWQRYHDDKVTDGRPIVHGHTPRLSSYLQTDVTTPGTKSFNIDCGCVYNGSHFAGQLAALNLDTKTVVFQENIED
ncbi:MAG TPA: serine/threonine protein phosphatase [Bacteroidetes bacterium]|jgi:serine/threonine protein phosphatase 1|nr:MAG: hypothetical protein ABR94_09800 [Sphingobacteriales bacterium BACL12 MAG-120802-bin5]HCK20718.1 serine/threonine protein phosphatase [Bacteroidota bacterium]